MEDAEESNHTPQEAGFDGEHAGMLEKFLTKDSKLREPSRQRISFNAVCRRQEIVLRERQSACHFGDSDGGDISVLFRGCCFCDLSRTTNVLASELVAQDYLFFLSD